MTFPQMLEDIGESIKLIPQECDLERVAEQIVDATASSVWEEYRSRYGWVWRTGELSHALPLLSSSISWILCGFTDARTNGQSWSRRHLCSRNRICLVVNFRCRCRQNGGCGGIVYINDGVDGGFFVHAVLTAPEGNEPLAGGSPEPCWRFWEVGHQAPHVLAAWWSGEGY